MGHSWIDFRILTRETTNRARAWARLRYRIEEILEIYFKCIKSSTWESFTDQLLQLYKEDKLKEAGELLLQFETKLLGIDSISHKGRPAGT